MCAGLLAACGSSTPMMPDAGPPLPVAMVDTDMDDMEDAMADFSCLGMRTAPAAGAAGEFTAHVHDFQGGTDTPTPMVELQVFPDNLVAAACEGTCVTSMTDANGDTMVTAPADGWFAYRVPSPADDDPVTTIGYNRAAPAAGGTVNLPTVSLAVIGLIPSLFMRTRVVGTGVVSGSLSDCMGRGVRGARLRLFRSGEGEIMPGPGRMDFFVGYFSAASGLPSSRATFTDVDGIYASANVAATTDLVRVEVWAVLTEGGEEERVACEAIQVAADAVTIISVGPTRNDYPAGHPCAE